LPIYSLDYFDMSLFLERRYGIGLTFTKRYRKLGTEITAYIIQRSALDCTGNSLFQKGITELGKCLRCALRRIKLNLEKSTQL